MSRRRLMWAGIGALGIACALHVPLLRWLAPAAQCPRAGLTAEGMEATRAPALASLRGSLPAPSRAAFEHVLGVTHIDEVRGPGCTWEVPSSLLHCEHDGSRMARFDARGVLVALDRSAGAVPAAEAARSFATRAAELTARYGAAHDQRGEPTAEHLGAPLHQASLRWRFYDLAVDLGATNVGVGVVVREQIRDIPPGSVIGG